MKALPQPETERGVLRGSYAPPTPALIIGFVEQHTREVGRKGGLSTWPSLSLRKRQREREGAALVAAILDGVAVSRDSWRIHGVHDFDFITAAGTAALEVTTSLRELALTAIARMSGRTESAYRGLRARAGGRRSAPARPPADRLRA